MKSNLSKKDLTKKVIEKMATQIHALAAKYLQDQLKSQFEYLQPFFLESIQNMNMDQPTKENFQNWKV